MSLSQVGTGVWRCVGASPAWSQVGCPPWWVLSLPGTHRQHSPAHTGVLQEVAVQPNPSCLHKLCPWIWNKFLKISGLDAFPRIWVVFSLQFVPKATPESSAASGREWQLIPHPSAHPSPGDRNAGKTHQAQGTSATTPCLWPIFPIQTKRRNLCVCDPPSLLILTTLIKPAWAVWASHLYLLLKGFQTPLSVLEAKRAWQCPVYISHAARQISGTTSPCGSLQLSVLKDSWWASACWAALRQHSSSHLNHI